MGKWKFLLIPLFVLGAGLYMLLMYSGEEDYLQKREGEKNITFMSGGLREQERAILEGMGRKYSLKVIFSNERGEYLSDVTVRILGQRGEPILTTVSNGPWFFINLPSGTYDLEVSFRKKAKRMSQVRIEEKSQTVVSVRW
jgi:hypothetical protein